MKCTAVLRAAQNSAGLRVGGGAKQPQNLWNSPNPFPTPQGRRYEAQCLLHIPALLRPRQIPATKMPHWFQLGLKKAFEGVEGWVFFLLIFFFFFAGGMRRRGKKIWHCSSSLSTTHTWEGWRTEARSKGWSAAITGESTVVITAQHSNLCADKEPIASQRGGSTSVSHAPRPRPTSPPIPCPRGARRYPKASSAAVCVG